MKLEQFYLAQFEDGNMDYQTFKERMAEVQNDLTLRLKDIKALVKKQNAIKTLKEKTK